VYCVALQKTSDSMLALAEDHRNDIISNLAAIGFGAIASQVPRPHHAAAAAAPASEAACGARTARTVARAAAPVRGRCKRWGLVCSGELGGGRAGARACCA